MASIKAGGSGYFLVNDKPYQRGAYEASFSGGTAGAETHVRIFAVDTSDGIRNILSLTEISTIESDSGTYADAAELKTALEGFFFRNIGGGSGGAVDSVNGQTGSVILNLDDVNDVPPYPNDGGDYVLVENNGTLTWEVNGGGGSVNPTNGLQDINGDIGLGGQLEQNTNIDLNTKGLTLIDSPFNALLNYSLGSWSLGTGGNNISIDSNSFSLLKSDGSGPLSIVASGVPSLIELENPNSGGGTVRFRLSSYLPTTFTDSATELGIQYDADYSANNANNPRWIPDKEYVDNTSGGGLPFTQADKDQIDDNSNATQQNATDIATAIAAGIENKNDITDLENNKVSSVTAGTGGVSVTGTATDPVINFEQTTAGLLQNVYFTGEEETTSEGTFYLTKRADRGTVADERQTVVLASNETEAFPQDFLGAPSPTSAPIISGVYAAFPILQVSTNQNNQRFKIEAYITDADGVPTGVGDGPVGSLGVNTVLIADSGIIDLQANNPTNVNCQGDVINTLTIEQGERFRYRVIAERVGTGSQNKTITLFQGSDYNSYFQIPAPGIIQPSTPSQYIVSFAKAGLISAPITLETQAGFTQTTGKYFGGGVNAVVKGFRFNSGLGSAIQAADFIVQLNYRDPDAGAPYTPAQGTLLVEETLFSTSGAVAALYNVSGEVILNTPVPIVAEKVYFLDISNLGGINFTDLEVEVLIETTPMTPNQFSFPFLF